jgi:hypothetical protein
LNEQQWRPVVGSNDILRARYRADFGEPHALLVKLAEDDYLVYSPGRGQLDSARQLIADEARVILLAPSMGHSLGLREWSEGFSHSRVVSTSGARNHLAQKTALPVFHDSREINSLLPDHIRIVDVPDNSFGECWLRIETPERIYWAVCDSLMNLPSLGNNFLMRGLLKCYGLGVGLHLHKRFRRGVKDKSGFLQWALQQFDSDKAQVLIPCHGDIDDASDLAQQLRRLLERNFPA